MCYEFWQILKSILRYERYDLVPFAQCNKCEKHPGKRVTFIKVADCNFTRSNTLPEVFFVFFKFYKRY